MIVLEKNEGTKIPYEVNGTKICFNDDLGLNLDVRQTLSAKTIDICTDWLGDLQISTNGAKAFVAEIALPEAEYVDEEGEATKKTIDMDKVTLTLWSID